MISESSGDEYLQQFDELDLGELANKRIAVFTLENYFGIVQHKVITNVFDGHMNDRIIGQWTYILEQFHEVDGFETPEVFESLMRELKGFRDKIYHNFDEGVDANRLLRIRELVEYWTEWIQRYSKLYFERYGRYTNEELEYITDFVDDVADMGQYPRAIEAIKREVDYALRNLMKKNGVYPSLRNKLMLTAFHSDELDGIDEEIADRYVGLDRTVSDIRIKRRNGEDIDYPEDGMLDMIENGKQF